MGAVPIIYLAVIVLLVASLWKVFVKAGQPGWAAIVPFYNLYVMTQIGGLEIIWFVLTFVPIVNIVAYAKISIAVAEQFGKSAGFGIGLWLLGFIFYPILAFGQAEYCGGVAPPAPAMAPPVAEQLPPEQLPAQQPPAGPPA